MMKKFISSPIAEAANNIVRKPGIIKTKNDYINFMQWLDSSNKDLKKIKIPDKKNLEKLELKFTSGFFDEMDQGDGGIDPFGALIGGGLGGMVFGGGKKILGKIFPRAAEKTSEKVGVSAAEKIAAKSSTPIAQDAAKVAALKGGGEIAEKGAGLAGKLIPGLATAVNLGIAGYRFSQGDIVGGSLSALSAVPVLGWAAVGIDLAREFGAFEGTPFGLKKEKPKNKIEARLRVQEKKQLEEAAKSKVTFESITQKFDKVVRKFENISFGITGSLALGKGQEYEPSSQPLGTDDLSEPPPPELPPGSYSKAPDEVLSDAAAFRQAFPLPKGTPKLSNEPYELQMRENTSLGELGNDPTVDSVHASGSAHYENRAIDIPINNMELGDKVASWWRGKGYKVLWKVDGHYNHVHVQWSKGQKEGKGSQQSDQKINTLTKQQSIEDFIKGTKEGDRILKDPKLKAQLLGTKYQYRGSMVTTPVTDSGVKQIKEQYNAYVRNLREVRKNQPKVEPSEISMPIAEIAPSPTQAGQSIMFINNQSSASQAQSQIVPIPISSGGGGSGVVIVSPSEGQILNSLWKTILLTNLSSA